MNKSGPPPPRSRTAQRAKLWAYHFASGEEKKRHTEYGFKEKQVSHTRLKKKKKMGQLEPRSRERVAFTEGL